MTGYNLPVRPDAEPVRIFRITLLHYGTYKFTITS
jgi:hypothetical protein